MRSCFEEVARRWRTGTGVVLHRAGSAPQGGAHSHGESGGTGATRAAAGALQPQRCTRAAAGGTGARHSTGETVIGLQILFV